MFCREQAAQLRTVAPEVEAAGASIILIGNGSPAQARRFVRRWAPEMPLYVSPSRDAYDQAGMRREVSATVSPRVLGNAARALRSGFRQGWTQGDPWQQGGVLVVDTDGTVLWSYLSRSAGDHPSPEEILEATREALAGREAPV